MEKKLPPSPFGTRTTYEKWLESEGLEVVTGYHVADVNRIPLKPWGRKGGLGAFINLEGGGQTNDAYVCEILPGQSLKPQRHLFEELAILGQQIMQRGVGIDLVHAIQSEHRSCI